MKGAVRRRGRVQGRRTLAVHKSPIHQLPNTPRLHCSALDVRPAPKWPCCILVRRQRRPRGVCSQECLRAAGHCCTCGKGVLKQIVKVHKSHNCTLIVVIHNAVYGRSHLGAVLRRRYETSVPPVEFGPYISTETQLKHTNPPLSATAAKIGSLFPWNLLRNGATVGRRLRPLMCPIPL